MALLSGSIPNLINGVSQQPASLRLPTQAQTQQNGLSDVVKGLQKRPPTEHIAFVNNVPTADYSTAFFHTMRLQDSDGVLRPYFVIIGPVGISVYNSTGVQQTVTDSTGGYGYFSGITNFNKDLSATSVADYTFILNRTKKIKKGTTSTPVLKHEGMIVVKQGDYSTNYSASITYGGTTYTGSYSTRDSSDVAHEVDAKTDNIASQLMSALSGSTTGFTFEQIGNIIYVTRSDNAEFSLSATDSHGDTHTQSIKGAVSNLKDLPSNGKAGFIVKVNGDTAKNQDDYYVKLQSVNTGGDTIWKETVGPSVLKDFDNTTMPHRLIRNADGTFTFSTVTWDERAAGDDDTNPFPSFSNYEASDYANGQFTINDIFFYKNRLCFLSDENLICSESGSFFNFFQSTVLTVLDNAPIDVAVSNSTVSILKYAVPFNESLILFSDLTQFKVTNTDIFSSSTISVDVTTQFEASLNSRPAAAGKYVFFPTLKGVWSGVREYFVQAENDTNDASDITAHVPEYLTGQVTQLIASSNEDILLVRTSGNRQQFYVYSYYWQGNEKLQASWSTWTFGSNILNIEIDNSLIYLLVQRAEGIAIETINLSTDNALADTGTFGINLDRRFKRTSSTDVLPYSGGTPVSASGNILNENSEVATVLDGITAGDGTYTQSPEVVYTGIPYTFLYEFSPVVLKQDEKPVSIGRLQLKYLNVLFSSTASFDTSVSRQGQTASVKQFTGTALDSSNTIGTIGIKTGSFPIPIMAESSNVSVKLYSSTFHPASFQSAEWEGTYHLRSKRI